METTADRSRADDLWADQAHRRGSPGLKREGTHLAVHEAQGEWTAPELIVVVRCTQEEAVLWDWKDVVQLGPGFSRV